jgi:hypothetical protein
MFFWYFVLCLAVKRGTQRCVSTGVISAFGNDSTMIGAMCRSLVAVWIGLVQTHGQLSHVELMVVRVDSSLMVGSTVWHEPTWVST